MRILESLKSELAEVESDRRSLRSFGLVMCGALTLIGTFVFWKADWTATTAVVTLGSVAAAFAVVGLLTPALLRPLHRVWMAVAILLGFVMTRVILAIVFYLVITPIGLAMRLLGKDPLTKGPDPSLPSYWIPKEYRTRDKERLEKYY